MNWTAYWHWVPDHLFEAVVSWVLGFLIWRIVWIGMNRFHRWLWHR
jgi:hypothetical protein